MMQGLLSTNKHVTCGPICFTKVLSCLKYHALVLEVLIAHHLLVDLTRHLLYHYAHLGVIFTSVVVRQRDRIAAAEKVNQPDIVDFD